VLFSGHCLLWPWRLFFYLISMSHALIHTSPNFGEISLNIYEYIVFNWFFGSLFHVTLTFGLLTQSVCATHTYIHTWTIFFEICSNIYEDIVFTEFSGDCLRWPWPLIYWRNSSINHDHQSYFISISKTSMSQAQVHAWPNFGEICSNIYEYIVLTRFSGHCLLWLFDLISMSQTQIHTSLEFS